ncbi:ketopantoate reductase family protein [Pseudomonas citronellolis]|uniref:ketopantoate reductase family protein n=1 Tax=Pseudomonas citronellolis TaxID=53408 RepID=UPI002FDA10B2
MRILIVGAGAIGGYIGGRLLQAGQDVTFLVRPQRAVMLAREGLVVKSPLGDIHYPSPICVLGGEIQQPYDLILLSCKSYDLERAMEDFSPAVAEHTAILPLLNGMRHLDLLERRFTRHNVLGGQCRISLDRNASGAIVHHNDVNQISFGELDEERSPRTQAIAVALHGGAGFEAIPCTRIVQEMWEKWALIATGAGITCLMRAALGDILAAGGKHLVVALLDECAEIAARAGYPLRDAIHHRYLEVLTEPSSPLMASVLRDVERGVETEAEHILGDLLERRGPPQEDDRSILAVALVHLRAYEARRIRETTYG